MTARPVFGVPGKMAFWLVLAAAALCVGCDDGPGGQFIKVATTEQFQSMVLQAPRPVMVEFYKAGCPGCGISHPNIEAVSESYADRAGFVKVPREAKAVRQKYAVAFYPTVMVFKGGKPLVSKAGPQSRQAYAKMIDDALVAD